MDKHFSKIQSSPFGRTDVRLKIIISVCFSLAVILLDSLTALLAVALAGALLFALSKPNGFQIRLALLTVLPLIWGVMISQGFFYQRYPRQVILEILPPGWILEDGLKVYLQGIYYGLIQSLRMAAMIFTGYAICFSTSPEAFLKGLTALRVPFALAFMASAAINLAPLAFRELLTVREAMRIKGYRPFKNGVLNTIKTELKVPRPVLAATVRRSEELALSILTRGFSLENKRPLYNDPLNRTQRTVAFLLPAAILALAGCKLLFWLYQHRIFHHSFLRPFYAFCRDWL